MASPLKPVPAWGLAPVHPSLHPSLHPSGNPLVHSVQPEVIHAALMVAAAYGWIPPAPLSPATISPPAFASTSAQRIYVLVTTTALAVMATVMFFMIATHRAELSAARAQGAQSVAVAPLVPVPVPAITASSPQPASAPAPGRTGSGIHAAPLRKQLGSAVN